MKLAVSWTALLGAGCGLLSTRDAYAIPSPWWSATAWETSHTTATALTALLVHLALAMVAYLLTIATLTTLANLTNSRPLARFAEVVGGPMARRLLSGSLTIVALSPGSPAAAEPDEPVAIMVRINTDDTAGMARVEPTPVISEPPMTPQDTWTVNEGDHLWSIAEDSLTSIIGRTPTDRETTTYWQALIEANRAALLNPADPDLIIPGQVFELPVIPSFST